MAGPLRIAMIIQAYLPHIGGAERQLAALAPLLRARGAEVFIVTRRLRGLQPYEQIDGVPVHRLPALRPKLLASAAFTVAALPLLRRLRPDVLHAHELLSPTTTAVAAKRLYGYPVVAKVMRGGLLGDLAKLKGRALGRKRIALFREQVDAFITISREIDAELAAVGIAPERRRFIPNGVDVDRFAPVAANTKAALRERLRLPPSAPVAIFTGRLAHEKRVDLLVKTWPAVRAALPNATLVVAGEGPQAAALKALAGPGVLFVGRVEDVAPYLQAADVFVLPSATEGLSNALLEALACGLAAVATNVGGAPDVIENAHSGRLIAPDDPRELEMALTTTLLDAALRAELGAAARGVVRSRYSLPRVADRLCELYAEVASA